MSASGSGRAAVKTGTGFEHPVFFWAGAAACTAGVLLHLPMYYDARAMHYDMSGMRPNAVMILGMVLIVLGLVSALYGLVPRGAGEIARTNSRIRVGAMDDVRLNRRHVGLILVMSLAVTIDVMKPVTLGFVAPGMAHEYGLKSPANPHGGASVAWLPLTGITGTVIGSWIWGSLSDRIGRRASILFAGLLFVTTSICGAMPGYTWNLLMCLMMGIGAGGMLPITFTLLAETVPARHRGWLMVLIGGNITTAYALVSWLSGALTPTYGWRILWLICLPTGLLLIAVNHWIPESPRYLLARGRDTEAEAVMARYGARVRQTREEPLPAARVRGGYGQFLRRPYLGTAAAITVLGLSLGLITYGFQQWVPTNLQHLGYTTVGSAYVVRDASLLGLPVTAVVAWLYGSWGARRTLVATSLLTGLCLLGFLIEGDAIAHHRAMLSLLLVMPLAGVGAVVAGVSSYATEVFPTAVRSRGAGLAAGMTKAGGVLILAVVAVSATVPSIAVTALIGAAPLLLAALFIGRAGPETRRRQLEEITLEFAAVP